jgi:hypothetical protein
MTLLEDTQMSPTLPQGLLTPFILLKQSLSRTPALSIPNPNKIIHLYQYSDKGQALGLVAQTAGDSMAPITYLPKQVEPTYLGWLACLKVLATALNTRSSKNNLQLTYDSLVISQYSGLN